MRKLAVLLAMMGGFTLAGQSVQVQQDQIYFSGSVNEYDSLKWELISDANRQMAHLGERSANAPVAYRYPPLDAGKEIWFPTIDWKPVPGFRLVIQLKEGQESDTVWWNGNIQAVGQPLKARMIFSEYLEHWENQLLVVSNGAKPDTVSFVIPFAKNRQLPGIPLGESWSGLVRVWGKNCSGWKVLASRQLSIHPVERAEYEEISSLTDTLIRKRLMMALTYLIRSVKHQPGSTTDGGLYLFYDEEFHTYRRADWIWSYGPAISLLLEASEADVTNPARLRRNAQLMAETSLRFQQKDPGHPAYGLVMCRNDPRTDAPAGSESFYSPADSYFLAGWGWMPYYQASGDERFLHATALMTSQIGKLLTSEDGTPVLIEQDYLEKAGKWKNWTMDESGFGMKGAEAIFAVTQNPEHLETGRRYMEGLLAYLEREDGLWNRTWHRNDSLHADAGWPVAAPLGTPVLIKTNYSTRGLGWAMIGLLAAHGMMPDEGYLDKACRLAEHLLKSQAADGHWGFLFSGAYPGEVSEKGTALWSLLFYELYDFTQDAQHLEAARRALRWCMNHQVINMEAGASFGGITGINRESGVVYRRWSPLICSYTVSWFGLALLQELRHLNQP